MNQARVVDIHRYYRTGGVDWDKLRSNFDAVIISAGVGMRANPLLTEQVDGALAHEIPYCTYHIPDVADGPMAVQAKFYLSLPGVKKALTCLDIEAPYKGQRCINANEALAYNRRLEEHTGKRPLEYSNPNIVRSILRNAAWLSDYWWWVGQYYWETGFPFYRKFTGFDSFLTRFGNTFPAGVRKTPVESNVVLWQFTDKGRAQALCANAITKDPVYKRGMNDCDLNVSTIERTQFLSLLDGVEPLPEPPSPPASVWYRIQVPDRNLRITPNSLSGKVLVTLHYGDLVLVKATAPGVPGTWGRISHYKQGSAVTACDGYLYMNNLEKA